MPSPVRLVVPIKPLAAAKTRLTDGPTAGFRAKLTLAMAMDTVAAALKAEAVAGVLVVASRPHEVAALGALGAEVISEGDAGGLNEALRRGAAAVRETDPGCVVGALHADLPALDPAELDVAIAEARGRRSYCADRHGIGTTLLLSTPAGPLIPRFGPGSAAAHEASGAVALQVVAPTLRADVDTLDDLRHVQDLSAGEHTGAVLRNDPTER